MKIARKLLIGTIVLAPLGLIFAGWTALLLARQGGLEPFRVPEGGTRNPSTQAEVIQRGEYLARIGNCAGCHSAPGGAAYAGGRVFETPYGSVYSSNISTDPVHGIGAWSAQEFRHAMRHGVSRNGVQSPVFPYANFAHLDDAELDALYAYLATLPAVAQTPPADRLEFPANLPGAMTAWRLLYYRPAALPALADAPLARGQQLVNGIGHCGACHASRGSFSSLAAGPVLGGGRVTGWFAPALNRDSLQHFGADTLAQYLRGAPVQDRGAYGRMADVIRQNLQHLSESDAAAIQTYLRALPAPPPSRAEAAPRIDISPQDLAQGNALYTQHCADCHGEDGRGKAGKYPALADSSALTGPDAINLIKLIQFGAAAPTTPLHARPYTMPPFAQQLSAAQIAALTNALRRRWGNPQRPVTADDVDAWGGIEQH